MLNLRTAPAPARDVRDAPAPRAGPRLTYAFPAPELADCITAYQFYTAPRSPDGDREDWLLPGVANVRLLLDGDPVSLRIGRRGFAPLPRAALIGPTAQAIRATSNGGAMAAFGITPIGWARLFAAPAAELLDRAAPLERFVGPALPASLLAELASASTAQEAKPILDRLLRPFLAEPHPAEPEIRAFGAALADPDVTDVAAAAAHAGLSAETLRRVAPRWFGMMPKRLLRRARFLRAFLRTFRSDGQEVATIVPGYHDASHYLRDADHFLGATPRRFAALATPFLDLSLRAREEALGAPACVLHPPPGQRPSRSSARE